MENILNEQAEFNNAQATEVEKGDGARENEVSLGKFKDVNALLKAYSSLEAEFTKRSQRLKELEELLKPTDKGNSENNANSPVKVVRKGKEDEKETSTTLSKEEILKEYLKEILSSKSKAIVMTDEGAGIKTPVTKPRTIDEAGSLAREFLATKLK